MKLSVIIPCKNEEGTVERLLESLVRQTQSIDEVIIVDSDSTDGTVASVKSFADRLPIKLVAAGKGVAVARNEGASVASGDLLLFIDADAQLPPNFISQLTSQVEKRGLEVGGFSQRMQAKGGALRTGARVMNGYVRLMSVTPWPIFFSCFFMTKKRHDEIGGFDSEIWIMEDYDYAYRARKKGAKFGLIKNTYFLASARRFEEGEGHSIMRAIYAELYRYTHGMRLTKPLFTYEMGGDDTKKKSSE
jgi:glycosyltransferase involved in cell wall biosynthesis